MHETWKLCSKDSEVEMSNFENVHFWEIAFKVRARNVITHIFRISKFYNFG